MRAYGSSLPRVSEYVPRHQIGRATTCGEWGWSRLGEDGAWGS